ncbi:unnamed protein product [Chrysoparadoxa australica]
MASFTEAKDAVFRKVTAGRETFTVDERYTNLKPIGDGSYGFVCSAEDQKTGKKVAIKKVTDLFRDIGDAKRILRELKLLRHFKLHENIVSIYDIMTAPQGEASFKDIYIVTNLLESDLDRIISSQQQLSSQHFRYFIYQLMRGLKYIHSANVLHRDLKPSNLLVNANCDLAICDFGLARGVEAEEDESLTEYVVTRWYRAPELLCDSPHYGKSVDIWSVGCIFAEMLLRKAIFPGKNPMHQLKMILGMLGSPSSPDVLDSNPAAIQMMQEASGKTIPPLASHFPPDTDPQAIDLLRRMLKVDPSKRLTVEEALEHPFLSQLHQQMLHAEPSCEQLFDSDFEKRYFGPKFRNIPLGELQIMMLQEQYHYRPSASGASLLKELGVVVEEPPKVSPPCPLAWSLT